MFKKDKPENLRDLLEEMGIEFEKWDLKSHGLNLLEEEIKDRSNSLGQKIVDLINKQLEINKLTTSEIVGTLELVKDMVISQGKENNKR